MRREENRLLFTLRNDRSEREFGFPLRERERSVVELFRVTSVHNRAYLSWKRIGVLKDHGLGFEARSCLPTCLPAQPAWSEMQGVWKLVSWATGKGEEEEGGGVVKSDGENEVPFKADGDSFGFSSPVSWTQDGAAEEFEDAAYELAAKNESEGSTRRTTNHSVRSTQGQLLRDDEESPQDFDEGGLQGSLTAELDDEPEDPLHQRFRDFHLSHQLATGLHRESGLPKSQSYASSRSLRSKNVVVLSGGEDGRYPFFAITCLFLSPQVHLKEQTCMNHPMPTLRRCSPSIECVVAFRAIEFDCWVLRKTLKLP